MASDRSPSSLQRCNVPSFPRAANDSAGRCGAPIRGCAEPFLRAGAGAAAAQVDKATRLLGRQRSAVRWCELRARQRRLAGTQQATRRRRHGTRRPTVVPHERVCCACAASSVQGQISEPGLFRRATSRCETHGWEPEIRASKRQHCATTADGDWPRWRRLSRRHQVIYRGLEPGGWRCAVSGQLPT